jgi:hypothetical protein
MSQGYIGDLSGEDAILGEMVDSKAFLYPHLHFTVGYTGDQIVAVQISTDVSVDLRPHFYYPELNKYN